MLAVSQGRSKARLEQLLISDSSKRTLIWTSNIARVLTLKPSVASTWCARRSLLLCLTAAHLFWNAGFSACSRRPYNDPLSQSCSSIHFLCHAAYFKLVEIFEENCLRKAQGLANEVAQTGVALNVRGQPIEGNKRRSGRAWSSQRRGVTVAK